MPSCTEFTRRPKTTDKNNLQTKFLKMFCCSSFDVTITYYASMH